MKSAAKGRARPTIEPISTNHGGFNDLSKRLIPVRGESPPLNSGGYASKAENVATPASSTTLPPLSASIFTRRGIFPDVFVIPVDLPRQLRPVLNSATRYGEVLSPLPDEGRFTVRVVVHSNSRHFGLTRQFDVSTLRATIPGGMSPRTPTLDENFSLAVLETRNTSPLPESPIDAIACQNPASAVTTSSGNSPMSEREAKLGYRAVPIDIHFARAHLPALASIMMSNQVQRGNTIELPVPHPKAWKHTIMYVYTGNENYATHQVKRNILYLGGKV